MIGALSCSPRSRIAEPTAKAVASSNAGKHQRRLLSGDLLDVFVLRPLQPLLRSQVRPLSA